MIKQILGKIGFVLFVILILSGVGPLHICYRFITIMIYRCRGYCYSIQSHSITQEQKSWCLECNIKYKDNAEAFGTIIFNRGLTYKRPIFFKKEADIMAFKLRWL